MTRIQFSDGSTAIVPRSVAETLESRGEAEILFELAVAEPGQAGRVIPPLKPKKPITQEKP